MPAKRQKLKPRSTAHSKPKSNAITRRHKERRHTKVNHASHIHTPEDAGLDDDLLKFEDRDLESLGDSDLDDEINAEDVGSDLDMDLEEGDSQQDSEQEDDDVDLERELIVGKEAKEQTKKEKKRKEVKVIERHQEVQFDAKSQTQVDRIKNVLKAVEGKDKGLSLSYAMRLLQLFRIAISIDQEQAEEKKDHKGKEKPAKEPKEREKIVSIVLASSTSLYTQVIKTAIEKLPKLIVESFKGKLNFTEPSMDNFTQLRAAYKEASKTQTILMKSFIANYLKLLKISVKDIKLQTTFLPSIIDIIKIVFPYQKYKKSLINCLLNIMCKSYYTVEKGQKEDNSSQAILICFDAIRKLISYDEYTHEGLANYTYKKFLNVFGESSHEGGAGSNNPKIRENLRVLENCFCELLSMDYIAAYQVCFALIRKLANVLHTNRLKNNEESVKSKKGSKKSDIKSIVNWQYHHYIHLLSVVIYTHNVHSSELNLLIYPYTQICIATLEILLKNTIYFPYTLKICKILNTMTSLSTPTYIPVSMYLLHLFTGKDEYFSRHTKGTKSKLPNYETALKISKEFYHCKETQDYIFKACINELKRYLNTCIKSISFPELVVPVLVTLKAFKKNCSTMTYVYIAKGLIKKICEVEQVVKQVRDKASRGTKDAIEQVQKELEQLGELFKLEA